MKQTLNFNIYLHARKKKQKKKNLLHNLESHPNPINKYR